MMNTFCFALYSIAIFLSAFLLFAIEPAFAKSLLPMLGGAPAVWNTCMLCFQFALLAGYLFAHTLRRLSVRYQVAIQAALLIAAPLLSASHPLTLQGAESQPVLSIAKSFLGTIGLPFFLLSSLSPLLQKWFSRLQGAEGKDPYYLYGASNLGSFAALLLYPFAIEPHLTLQQQTRFWYLALIILVLALLGLLGFRYQSSKDEQRHAADAPAVNMIQKLRWAGFAFLPSSLMLGVTTFITSDLASFPLLWILPLSLYLLSFPLVFSSRVWIRKNFLTQLFNLMMLGTLFFLTLRSNKVEITLIFHLLNFFVIAVMCHQRLADERPHPSQLTHFYLWLALGGVLGGVFNSLLAPLIFNGVQEYPLMLLAAVFCRPSSQTFKPSWRLGLIVVVALVLSAASFYFQQISDLSHPSWRLPYLIILNIAPLLFCFYYHKQSSVTFALLLTALVAGQSVMKLHYDHRIGNTTIYQDRNFFGVSKVVRSGDLHIYYNGLTIHGMQNRLHNPLQPLGYYHPEGPLGDIMRLTAYKLRKIAVIGVGAGACMAYSKRGQIWDLYEINAEVLKIARDPRYFTYLDQSQAEFNMILGDGRQSLEKARNASYDLVILDAFTSDAIPSHLLTLEAIDLYLKKMTPSGILVFHISNKTLDLGLVLGTLAKERGLEAVFKHDRNRKGAKKTKEKHPSWWVVLSHPQNPVLEALLTQKKWETLERTKPAARWTDDYSNILSVLKKNAL